jgi:enoyl-[acyl-carrier-protein] reductase (NADH)
MREACDPVHAETRRHHYYYFVRNWDCRSSESQRLFCFQGRAIVALTRNMALDWARFQIRVNSVCSGFTRTAMAKALLLDPQRESRLVGLHPLGRLGTPEDTANAVVFLASDLSSWITGQALAVDGCFSVGASEDV